MSGETENKNAIRNLLMKSQPIVQRRYTVYQNQDKRLKELEKNLNKPQSLFVRAGLDLLFKELDKQKS